MTALFRLRALKQTRVVWILLFLFPLYPAAAQTQAGSTAQSGSTSNSSVQIFNTNTDLQNTTTSNTHSLGDTTSPEPAPSAHKGEFAFSPIPMINPSIGNGGGAAVMYVRRLDAGSPPSTFGGGGFGTGRASWGLGLGARLYLHNDRYRITVGGGGGEFNYNYFGIGTAAGEAGLSIPLSQRSRGFLVEPKIRVWKHWYAGPRYHLVTNRVALNLNEIKLPDLPDFNLDDLPVQLPKDVRFQTAALGLRVQRDTTDSKFYTRHGSVLDLTVDFFDPAFGANRNYKNVTLTYDKFLSFGAKNVLGIHGNLCTVTDQAPFFDLCALGQDKDLRGYQRGQFRDDRMLVGQMEFRRELFWRIGAVAFAGAGAVGKTFGDMGNAEPGGGVGVRFVLAKKNHVNLRADFAWGENSHATYVSLGEAF